MAGAGARGVGGNGETLVTSDFRFSIYHVVMITSNATTCSCRSIFLPHRDPRAPPPAAGPAPCSPAPAVGFRSADARPCEDEPPD